MRIRRLKCDGYETLLKLCKNHILFSTMYCMAGLVTTASVLHFMVKPVDPKFFEKPEPTTTTLKEEKDK